MCDSCGCGQSEKSFDDKVAEIIESIRPMLQNDGGDIELVGTEEDKTLAEEVRQFEPHAALYAGKRGTEVVEALIPQAAGRLNPAGHLLIEVGPMVHDAVCSLLKADNRLEPGPTVKDLARLPRVVQATRRPEPPSE